MKSIHAGILDRIVGQLEQALTNALGDGEKDLVMKTGERVLSILLDKVEEII